jgi:hypothetical protein
MLNRVADERLAPQKALLPVSLAVRETCGGAERLYVKVEPSVPGVSRRKP